MASHYIDYLMKKRLAPKTINCHLNSIRQFYQYLLLAAGKREPEMALLDLLPLEAGIFS